MVVDPRLKEQVDENIRKSANLTKEEEGEALDREIELRSKHLDLTQLEQGQQPDRLTAEWAAKGGIWKLVALIVDVLRKVFSAA